MGLFGHMAHQHRHVTRIDLRVHDESRITRTTLVLQVVRQGLEEIRTRSPIISRPSVSQRAGATVRLRTSSRLSGKRRTALTRKSSFKSVATRGSPE